jgi:hypothetical protein
MNVSELLKINFRKENFISNASISDTLHRSLDSKIKIIEKIKKEADSSNYSNNFNDSTEQLYNKFIDEKNEEQYTSRELRDLSFVIGQNNIGLKEINILSSSILTQKYLTILESGWNDRFLFGLFHGLIKNWNHPNKLNLEKLWNFINEKFENYSDEKPSLLSIKKNLKYYNINNGGIILGNELFVKKINLDKIFDFINIPESWFTYEYFSEVLVTYFEKSRENISEIINEVSEILTKHNNSITTKKILSRIITYIDKNSNKTNQDLIITLTFKHIGDPAKINLWNSPIEFNDNDKIILKKARVIMNEWLTKQFISVFFEKCINKIDRKKYWLRYVKHISQFLVVGPGNILYTLQRDERIKDVVLNRFSKVRVDKDNAALMFIIKDRLFVEFSDDGAFYVYKLSNPNCPSIDEPSFYSTRNLKQIHMEQLVYRTGSYISKTNSEGKMPHSNATVSWQEVVDKWFKIELNINA